MHDPLVKRYEELFEIEGERERRIKDFFRWMKRYKTYKEIFGEKRTQKLIREEISRCK